MKKIFFTIFFALFILTAVKLTAQPKREFRAAWVATVTNIDWPSSKTLSTTSQKNEVIAILDKHKANNINAILLQVRPSCDALYQGGYEPLSEYLVGVQGGNLSLYYDPLQFWIDEAHKRGMELHAWFNPYRSVVSSGSSVHTSHISKTKPEWNINYGGSPWKFLDPGIPEAKNYVITVIMDVVRRFNIDGVHFDDYFYPYGGMTNQDSATYANHKGSFNNIGDWRRNNVNSFIAMVHDSIKILKPWVKFGVSPFGIWKSGVPPGISGLDAYSQIYCDPMNWLTNKKVDYLTPQTYWVIGGSQDYSKLMPWWGEQTAANGRHLYTGNAAYRLSASSSNWPATEIQNQLELNRVGNRAQGIVFFSSKSITGNLKGIQDSLRANQFKFLAIPPAMPWLDTVPPLPPQNFIAGINGNTVSLQWQKGSAASDGDTVNRYAVYRRTNSVTDIDRSDAKNIHYIAMNGELAYSDVLATLENVQYAAMLTSFDKLWNESIAAEKIYHAPAGKPFMLVSRETVNLQEAAVGQQSTGTIKVLNHAPHSLLIDSLYTGSQQFSASVPSQSVADSATITITYTPTMFGTVTETLSIANNSVLGTVKIALQGYSPVPSLIVVTPSIIYGTINLGDTLEKQLVLSNGSLNGIRIDSLTMSLSAHSAFSPVGDAVPVNVSNSDTVSIGIAFIPDTAKLFIDTLFVYSNADNSPLKVVLFGIGQMQLSADPYDGMRPIAYQLSQNYPNPFNPTTTLSFTLPQAHNTSLRVYDLLGREVAVVVNDMLDAGMHQYQFDGTHLSSGIYLYRIVSGEFAETRKMVLQK
jgi:uncharacterized lipoprotein YddW (UPF0748 family)